MSTYKGKVVTVSDNRGAVYAKLVNLAAYNSYIETMPAEIKEKLGDVRFTDDSIIIAANPVGEIELKRTAAVEPSHIELSAVNSPVPLSLTLDLKETGEASTELAPAIKVDVPAMLKPLIGGKMQEAADKMGEVLATLLNR